MKERGGCGVIAGVMYWLRGEQQIPMEQPAQRAAHCAVYGRDRILLENHAKFLLQELTNGGVSHRELVSSFMASPFFREIDPSAAWEILSGFQPKNLESAARSLTELVTQPLTRNQRRNLIESERRLTLARKQADNETKRKSKKGNRGIVSTDVTEAPAPPESAEPMRVIVVGIDPRRILFEVDFNDDGQLREELGNYGREYQNKDRVIYRLTELASTSPKRIVLDKREKINKGPFRGWHKIRVGGSSRVLIKPDGKARILWVHFGEHRYILRTGFTMDEH